MQTIAFKTAMAITGLSRSSLWRRIREHPGTSETLGQAKGHKRRRIGIDSALAWSRLMLTDQDRALILGADAGHAGAQYGLGLRLLELGHPQPALAWLEQAAMQGHAEAMQRLTEGRTPENAPQEEASKTGGRTLRVAFALHPEREADLHAWVQGVPADELSAHIKQALRDYIARYAGQTVTVPVAMRRLKVPEAR
jgi:TPR repeat protein